MADLSNYQKKVVERYYLQRDTIMLNKLQELVTELYLADSQKKADRLWKQVSTAMTNLGVKPRVRDHILAKRDPQILAHNLRDWLKDGKNPTAR
jgi:hypothetical protein